MLLLSLRRRSYVALSAVVSAALAAAAVFVWPSASAQAAELGITISSPTLTAFWGHPVLTNAAVLLPDSYETSPAKRYPTIFRIHAFNEVYASRSLFRTFRSAMARAKTEFIVVALDASFQGGHHEFADSANNGPWGTALTKEIIPALEGRFRMLGTRQGRFLTGHSSGGWSALWLQVNYPEFFGGAWAVSPDPVDFRDFTGPDLTRVPPQNFYSPPSGGSYMMARRGGRDTETLQEFVEGPGFAKAQFSSFNAVFSPRKADGSPAPLFNVRNGVIDADVAAYWEAHYDIARIVRSGWASNGPLLKGKIHAFVGTADTFHLERSLKLFADGLQELGADAEIEFAPGLDHFDIFRYGGDLYARIVREMAGQAARDGIQ